MMEGVRNVYTSLQLLTISNEQIQRVRMGYHPERCGESLRAARALLLGSLSGEARAELASPFIAFLTSLAGGCFADPEALGGALKTLSLFTPQGRFLAASSGGAVHLAVLAAAALALTLLLLLPALFGKRRVKLRELH